MSVLKASSTNIPMGPCRFVWGVGEATEIILDRTKGGCHFKFKLNYENMTMDQTGSAPSDAITDGSECLFEIPLVTDDLKILNSLTPGTTLYTNATTSEEAMLYVEQVGTSLMEHAKKCRLEPIGKPESQHVTFFKAIPVVDWDHVYDSKNPHIKMVRIIALPDNENDGRKYVMGPESALPTTPTT